MKACGILDKMPVRLSEPVEYFLQLGTETFAMNEMLGHKLRLTFTGNIFCTVCGRKTSKSFGEGLCYPCFENSPENSPCIIHPELCEAHLGRGRDPEWEKTHHLQPHFVYLALTGAVKVGVTRSSQIPTRWIDQGAASAIILAETPYRQLAGQIEVALKQHLTDKTNWLHILRNHTISIDLVSEKLRVSKLLPEPLQAYVTANHDIVTLQYPVNEYPEKVTSISLDKVPQFDLTLTGIRGQYLIFEGGKVINIRRHSGYEVELTV
ncbi:MAG: DUF2797 domain-containing protein [Chitinophagales bacterium]|nr:DUF2797 domain-containing protein [Chitinophagales bacterium]MDW8417938.1 DUF2797 domain-containing protein [Chitinophagales bacterium]